MTDLQDARLEVEDVSVKYNNGHLALDQATFSLDAGTICALVGVNGSGKSTLFKSIMGFVVPSFFTASYVGRHLGTVRWPGFPSPGAVELWCSNLPWLRCIG